MSLSFELNRLSQKTAATRFDKYIRSVSPRKALDSFNNALLSAYNTQGSRGALGRAGSQAFTLRQRLGHKAKRIGSAFNLSGMSSDKGIFNALEMVDEFGGSPMAMRGAVRNMSRGVDAARRGTEQFINRVATA